VITHFGLSEAGHYTSYIRMDNDEWKYFDDEKITNFDYK
jgi:ubiquitin C-terminal hydrolase